MIADNLEAVRRRIRASCEKSKRSADEVRLICVTKGASVEDIKEAIDSGAAILGENRVQEAAVKCKAIGGSVLWHLIGHLQTNKVRDAVKIFSLIQSIDSLRLAEAVDREAAKISKVQDVLIQVNTSGEETKFGIEPSKVFDLLKVVSLYHNINIKGLMMIAPEVNDPETVRPYFRALRDIRDKINAEGIARDPLRILSMGMTNDFEIAIEEGSDMVRIGRAIFRGAM